LPYEKAEEVIRSQDSLALANCYCRHEAELLGKSCGAPKDVCLVFGPFAEFAASKGFVQTIDQVKALEVLAKAEEAGLVHVTDNVASGANFMCNCCGCCCLFLKTITQLKHPGAIAQAAFVASVDQADCTLCGQCQEICQVGAISQEGDQPAAVEASLCLGCGQCATHCPAGAISMDRRQTPAPPADWRVLVGNLRNERSP
jgi:MinD superfamily P-loop ATPase containing an inserted ferredoxin domain